MSKSLGNVMTMRSFMDKYHAEIYKYLCLSVHYRSAFSLDESRLSQVIESLRRIYSALEVAELILASDVDSGDIDGEFEKQLKQLNGKIEKSLDDDFNSSEMISSIFESVRVFNSLKYAGKKVKPQMKATTELFVKWLKSFGSMAALFQENPTEFLDRLDDILLEEKGLTRSKVNELVSKRREARENKQYDLGDQLKQELIDLGIELRDGQQRAWSVSS